MIIQEDCSLKPYNTFHLAARCRRMVMVEHPDEVLELADKGVFQSHFYILGGGSNVLFTQDFSGTIVHPAFVGIERVGEDKDSVQLRVAAGEEWADLLDYCLKNELYGLENLIGIPGLVGSAPVQNIGAYGVEVKDCIERVEGVLLDSREHFNFSNDHCRFGYRDSVFKHELKGKAFITFVTFRLAKESRYVLTYKALTNELERRGWQPSLHNIASCITDVRNSKLPDITRIGCAGSFFKNPVVTREEYEELLGRVPDLVSYPAPDERVKLAAGQLIEKAGWKGRRLGDAGVYDKQALVLVNYGDATPAEIVNVCRQVIWDVEDKFGVTLSPEVNIL